MTLASQLKQKSKSINLDRLKIAAKKKKVEREKAARNVALELGRKERAIEKEKQRKVEQKRLINWLVPGLLPAWNREDRIPYNPLADEEKATAKKFLGFKPRYGDLSSLNNELNNLDIEIKALQNRLSCLETYVEINIPSITFDIKSLLPNFEVQDYLFSKEWRDNFQRESLQFEKSALSNYAAKVKAAAVIAKSEIAHIHEDQDVLEVQRLADTLKPRIDTFHSQYQALMSSPSSYFRIGSKGDEFEGVNYIELTTRREYQLAVARYVLREMNIHCFISPPDVIGKFMAAFRIASGDNLIEALLEHISDPELTNKFLRYSRLLDRKPKTVKRVRIPEIKGDSVAILLSSTFASIQRVHKILKTLEVQNLTITQGYVSFIYHINIDELSETSQFPVFDRLAYDIQWLRSAPGQKFKKEFTKYLDELASDGKYSAKLKVFSVDDGMLIELPSGKEIPCDMEWDSFEQLMSQLELEITETTSTGVVKLKWG